MSLQGVDNIERGNSLALGVLSVCDSIADDTFKEGLENTSGFFVDHCFDASDTVARRGAEGRTHWLRYA